MQVLETTFGSDGWVTAPPSLELKDVETICRARNGGEECRGKTGDWLASLDVEVIHPEKRCARQTRARS